MTEQSNITPTDASGFAYDRAGIKVAVAGGPAVVEKYARAAAHGYLDAVKQLGTRTVEAAASTWAATETGVIPQARSAKAKDGTPKRTSSPVMTAATFAALFEVTESTVTKWRRLGRVLAESSVKPSDKLWQQLATQGWVTDKPVGLVLDKDGWTLAQLKAAVSASRDENGKRRTDPDTEGNTSGAGQGEGGEATVTLTGTDLTPRGRIKALLASIVKDLPALDTSEWEVTEREIATVVSSEITRRKAVAEAEAATGSSPVITPTPATVSKAQQRRQAAVDRSNAKIAKAAAEKAAAEQAARDAASDPLPDAA